jgi:hypothetical protein
MFEMLNRKSPPHPSLILIISEDPLTRTFIICSLFILLKFKYL